MYLHNLISKIAVLALSLLLIGALAGCAKNSDTSAIKQREGAIAKIVNGSKIYESDVELEAVAQGLIAPGDPFGPQHSAYQSVLDQVIEQRLMAQEAERLGLPEEPMAMRRLAAARERILANLLIEHLVAQNITEARIDEMYAEQVALQQLDDQVSIAHILMGSEAEARALYDEIQSGASFDSLVFAHTLDEETRLKNGDMGFVAPNKLPEPFGTVIANTSEGEVSEPFQSKDGWHILLVRERRSRAPKTKEEMRPEIVTFLTLTEISNILGRLRAEASFQEGSAGADESIGLNPLPSAPTDPEDRPDNSL